MTATPTRLNFIEEYKENRGEQFKAGFLQKQGNDMFSAWRKRWIAIKGPLLFYLSAPTDAVPLGALDVRGAIVSDDPKNTGVFTIVPQTSYHGETIFEKRPYHFKADSSQLKKEWTDAISKAQDFFNKPKPSAVSKTPSAGTTTTAPAQAAPTPAPAVTPAATPAAAPTAAPAATAAKGKIILVTGASGNVGSMVAKLLMLKGETVRILVRDAASTGYLSQFLQKNPSLAEVKTGDLNDQASLLAAMQGVKAVFLVTPLSEKMVNQTKNVVAAAKDAKTVTHIVKLSIMNVQYTEAVLTKLHKEAEQVVIESGLNTTILRPSLFMNNIVNDYAVSIANEGEFYGHIGMSEISFVSVADIAAVATVVLTSSGHYGKKYTLTGPRAVSLPEIAAVLSAKLKKHIKYVEVNETTLKQYLMKSLGLSTWAADALMEIGKMIREGRFTYVGENIENLTAAEPTSIEHFLDYNLKRFTKEGANITVAKRQQTEALNAKSVAAPAAAPVAVKEIIAVTGANGNLGRRIVLELAKVPGIKVRALCKTTGRFNWPPSVEEVELDTEDEDSTTSAFKGVSKTIIVPPSWSNLVGFTKMCLFGCMVSEVKYVMKISLLGASNTAPPLLLKMNTWSDALVRKSGITFTLLFPNMFFQNAHNFFGENIHKDGAFASPLGADTKITMVDANDVAVVAAKIAANTQSHEAKEYEITGPAAVSYNDIAAALSSAIGKPVKYTGKQPKEDMKKLLGDLGLADFTATALSDWYAAIDAGGCGANIANVADTFEKIVGGKGTTLEQFAKANVARFTGTFVEDLKTESSSSSSFSAWDTPASAPAATSLALASSADYANDSLQGDTVLVTGSNGDISRRVVKELAMIKGGKIHAGTTHPKTFLRPSNVEEVEVDPTEEDQLIEAGREVTKLFIQPAMWSSIVSYVKMFLFSVITQTPSWCKHIVKVSHFNAANDSAPLMLKMHTWSDTQMRKAGIPYTIIKPNILMQTLHRLWARPISEKGEFYVLSKSAKVSFIDAQDIAVASAKILANASAHANKEYDLTGPAAVSYEEVATILSKVLAKEVKAVEKTTDELKKMLIEVNGLQEFVAQAWVDIWADEVKSGKPANVSTDIEKLIGRKPRSLEDWAKENKARFDPNFVDPETYRADAPTNDIFSASTPAPTAAPSNPSGPAATPAATPAAASATPAAAPAAAKEVDLSGSWEIDLKASEKVAPLLEASGVGFLERKMMATAKIVMKLEQTPTHLTMTIDTPVKKIVEVSPLNGTVERKEPGMPVGVCDCTTKWNADKSVLITSYVIDHNGAKGTLMIGRRLLDNNTLEQAMKFKSSKPDGKEFPCRRIFIRK